jgi:hypothetical protein
LKTLSVLDDRKKLKIILVGNTHFEPMTLEAIGEIFINKGKN